MICAVFDPTGRPPHRDPATVCPPLPPLPALRATPGRAPALALPGVWVTLYEVG